LQTVSPKLYGLRKETVEPVFGIIKEAIGFRRFMLRGLEKVSLEWTLVTTSYNLKRLFNLKKYLTTRHGVAVPRVSGHQVGHNSALAINGGKVLPLGRDQTHVLIFVLLPGRRPQSVVGGMSHASAY
jgi:hypothetical protein